MFSSLVNWVTFSLHLRLFPGWQVILIATSYEISISSLNGHGVPKVALTHKQHCTKSKVARNKNFSSLRYHPRSFSKSQKNVRRGGRGGLENVDVRVIFGLYCKCHWPKFAGRRGRMGSK